MRRLTVLLACVVMALTLIAVAAGVSAAAPNQQQPPPDHFYGALDYSKAKGILYWGTGTSKDAANQASYDACTKGGATDCITVVWVYNGWVGVAESSKFLAVDWGATKEEASAKAVKTCESGGAPPCKVLGTQQTAIDPNKQATGGYELPGP